MVLGRQVQVPSDLGTSNPLCFLFYFLQLKQAILSQSGENPSPFKFLAKILGLSPHILLHLFFVCLFVLGCKREARKESVWLAIPYNPSYPLYTHILLWKHEQRIPT